MQEKWTPLEEINARLEVKVSTLLTTIGTAVLQAQGTTRKELAARLKTGRTYLLPSSPGPGNSFRACQRTISERERPACVSCSLAASAQAGRPRSGSLASCRPVSGGRNVG